jgi:hypothetical protein
MRGVLQLNVSANFNRAVKRNFEIFGIALHGPMHEYKGWEQ